MVYKVNGVELLIQPTSGRWVVDAPLMVDGNGHPIYSSVKQFELQWNLIDPATHNQIQNFFNTVISTGTASVELPEFAGATYNFHSYSGCVLYQPDVSQYFTENVQNVVLLISNIRI